MPLFTAAELSGHLQKTVTAEAAASCERVVWGWLKPALGLTERPNPVPDEVFSWAIELGGIAHENPAGLASYQLGAERIAYSAERRAEILADAADGGRPGTGGAPRGSFPPACAWPDQARIR